MIYVIVALFASFTAEMTDTQQNNIDNNNDIKSEQAAAEELQQVAKILQQCISSFTNYLIILTHRPSIFLMPTKME